MELMQQMFQYITSRKDTVIMVWDRAGGWNTASKNSFILKGADISKVDLFHMSDWIYIDDKPTFEIFLQQLEAEMKEESQPVMKQEEKAAIAVRLLGEDDVYRYHNVECWLEREEDRLMRMFVMISRLDVKEVHRIKLAEKFTSDRDPSILNEQGVELIKSHPDKTFAVIQFDVAKFKMIPVNYGDSKATELLNFFSNSLRVICNHMQIYSRLSADVFMIVTPYETEQDIYDFIAVLDDKLLGFDGMDYRLVYGVCYVNDISRGLRTFGDAAAMARQGTKGDVLRHIAFYREEIKKNISTSKYIEDNMHRALKNGEFVMFLQPKCTIADGSIVGAEALVRWIHPERGIIPPMQFVPVFEKNGFVVKMDQYIWEEACKLIRKWLDDGLTPVPISVNVSRKHLHNAEFVEVLEKLVAKYDIPKHYLEIEITETMDEGTSVNGISILKEHGFTLLMDDFGSGYSSLNTLKNTQFDVIKIDREFLQDFIGSDRGQKIVEHTIKMTKAIGLDLVAEGVENKEQAEFLENCGCNIAQGFFYAKPMRVEEFQEMYGDFLRGRDA